MGPIAGRGPHVEDTGAAADCARRLEDAAAQGRVVGGDGEGAAVGLHGLPHPARRRDRPCRARPPPRARRTAPPVARSGPSPCRRPRGRSADPPTAGPASPPALPSAADRRGPGRRTSGRRSRRPPARSGRSPTPSRPVRRPRGCARPPSASADRTGAGGCLHRGTRGAAVFGIATAGHRHEESGGNDDGRTHLRRTSLRRARLPLHSDGRVGIGSARLVSRRDLP